MGYYVTVEQGVNIYVEDINPEGKNIILFIHGWPANHKLFEYQFDVLPGMGYRCIGWTSEVLENRISLGEATATID